MQARRPCLRVASAFPIRAFASLMQPRHYEFLSSVWSRCQRVRITSRWSSPQFLVFLLFLQASFPISHSFMPYKA
ncbi:uncharacterized protein DS421_8g225010 [Arachis hypogaea]|nr:uncharacterized protein DS421_8g225010 [Arachis hypogaea]